MTAMDNRAVRQGLFPILAVAAIVLAGAGVATWVHKHGEITRAEAHQAAVIDRRDPVILARH